LNLATPYYNMLFEEVQDRSENTGERRPEKGAPLKIFLRIVKKILSSRCVQLRYGNNRKEEFEVSRRRSRALPELLVACRRATISPARERSIKVGTKQTRTGNEIVDDLGLRTRAYFYLILESRGAITWHSD